MFGYVKTDLPNMFVKDTVLYKAMYCGLCKGIGKRCGTCGRFVLNYDLSFLSILLHNIADIDVKITKQRCILHHIKKRPMAETDNLTERVGAFNVILAYHKVKDDITDNNKGRLKRAFISKSYKRAKKSEPLLDGAVCKMYSKLLDYEKKNGDSIDICADFFSQMMVECCAILLERDLTESESLLFYDIGKWVYLIDAIDDYDKDIKRKNFNVFYNSYKECKSFAELIKAHGEDVLSVFTALLSEIYENARKIDYKFNHDLIDNVLYNGLREQTKKILEKK